MHSSVSIQLSQWFDCEDYDDLRDICCDFLSPLGLEPSDPLLRQLDRHTKTDWSVVVDELGRFPEPPAMRQALMRYLTGVLAFMRCSDKQCGDWLPDPAKAYLMMERPAENAFWLNLFLEKPLPATPAEWISAASIPLGEWLPLNLLIGGSKDLVELIPVLSYAQLVENQQIQPDLDYLLRQPSIQGSSNLRDQIEEAIYQDLQSQCDALSRKGFSFEQVEHYYTQVRLFFCSRSVFTTRLEADDALKACLLDGDMALMAVPAEYRLRLLNKALIQVPHDGRALPLCPCTGVPLWRDPQSKWQTVSRDPQIRQKVSAGILPVKMETSYIGRAEYYQLHPQIIRDWYLPGQLELHIADVAQKAGWKVTLRPKRDQVDVLCEHSDSSRILVIDGKDWRNAYLLGRTFIGFKSYSDPSRYLGLVVVPDHQLAQPKYRERFKGGQAHLGQQARLLNLSAFRQLVINPATIGNVLLEEDAV